MPRFEHGALPVGRQLPEMDGFMAPPRAQDRVGDVERRQALVDDPRERRDVGARQITFELHRLVNRRGLRQRDEQDRRELWVPQAGQQPLHGVRGPTGLPQHLAVIGLGRVQQQQRVAGRRRIDDDELVLALRDGVGEGAKDRNLLRARRAQVFLEQRAPCASSPWPAVASTSSV